MGFTWSRIGWDTIAFSVSYFSNLRSVFLLTCYIATYTLYIHYSHCPIVTNIVQRHKTANENALSYSDCTNEWIPIFITFDKKYSDIQCQKIQYSKSHNIVFFAGSLNILYIIK